MRVDCHVDRHGTLPNGAHRGFPHFIHVANASDRGDREQPAVVAIATIAGKVWGTPRLVLFYHYYSCCICDNLRTDIIASFDLTLKLHLAAFIAHRNPIL
ncbi:hypothetical protein Y032_0010g1196 [Ancylostoma ceylanicum]|nr:hypothetical protein Y032_0010g1196 [Ancylostoma ceylanicum]